MNIDHIVGYIIGACSVAFVVLLIPLLIGRALSKADAVEERRESERGKL